MLKMKKLFLVAAIVLAAIVFKTTYDHIQSQRLVKTRKAMDEIASFILIARNAAHTSTDKITHNGCSFCPCRDGKSHTDDPVNAICVYNWNNVMISVWRAVGGEGYPPEHLLRDAWGSPFGLDEDDSGAQCPSDKLVSFGPDGRYGTPDDLELQVQDASCR
jgi:hypothetical protein